MSKSLDLALEVLRLTPHTRTKKTAFEMHYGRKPLTDLQNWLGINPNENCSAKPDTVQIYSFTGKGKADSDVLPMKQPRKSTGKDNVSTNFPFLFVERNHQRGKFDPHYAENVQIAVSGTEHTVCTENGRVSHRKLISKPLCTSQALSQQGKGPRGPDGKFLRESPEPLTSSNIHHEPQNVSPPPA